MQLSNYIYIFKSQHLTSTFSEAKIVSRCSVTIEEETYDNQKSPETL